MYVPKKKGEKFNAIEIGKFSGRQAMFNPQKFVRKAGIVIEAVDLNNTKRLFGTNHWRFEKA